jgi:hypothetical protein
MKRSGIDMEKEATYQTTMETELGKFDSRVDSIRKENEHSDGSPNLEYNVWQDALQLKQVLVSQKLENLKYVTGDIWNGLIEGFEKAKTELSEIIENGFPGIIQGPIVSPVIISVKPAV